MNRMSPLEPAAALGSLGSSSPSLEKEKFSLAQAIARHMEEFIAASVLQNRSLKSLSPNKVAIFCKIGDDVISFSSLGLSSVDKDQKEVQIEHFCADAIDGLEQSLSYENLTRDSVLTVQVIFLRYLQPRTAFLAVRGACSTCNYRNVTSTMAPRLTAANAKTALMAHCITGARSGVELDLIAFLFPVEKVISPKFTS